jgi:beta-glucosidase
MVAWRISVQADHFQIIREIGAASTILLKNVRATLPLNVKTIKRM